MGKQQEQKKSLKKKFKEFIHEILSESQLGIYRTLIIRVIETKLHEITDEQLEKLLKALRKKIDECLNDKDWFS